LGVDNKFTTKDTIYSSHKVGKPSKWIWTYAYLFTLNKIDDNTTQVILKASGGIGSISDKDMLDKYLPEELSNIRRN